MVLSSDDILIPETDETVYVRQLKIDKINEELEKKLHDYIKKRKCAVWFYLCKIETLNKNLVVYEKEHYCFIIKPNNNFKYQKDANALFDIITPYLNGKDDFVDVSIIGWQNTMQFNFKKEDCIKIYCQY